MRSHDTPHPRPANGRLQRTARPVALFALLVAGVLPALALPIPAGPGEAPNWQAATASGAGQVNTGNGNKLTQLPLVAWTARGGLPVPPTLYHNSQGSVTAPGCSTHWTHSFNVMLYADTTLPGTQAQFTAGDGTAVPFTYNASTGVFTAKAGYHEKLTYTTDGYGNFLAFTLTTKDGVAYLFNSPTYGTNFRLASITDRNGNALTLAYNTSGQVTGVTDPTGRALTFTYAPGTLVSVSDPSGATFTLAYGTSGDLSSVTFPDPDGSGPLSSPVVSYGYDGSHRVTSVTDPRGNARTFSYNSDGSLAWEKDVACTPDLVHRLS